MRNRIAILALGMLAATAPAQAQASFQPGQRVTVGLTGQQGTVIGTIGQPMMNGGILVRVHLDSMGAANPNVGVVYDSVAAHVTAGGATASAPAPAALPQTAAAPPQQYMPPRAAPPQIPPQATAAPATAGPSAPMGSPPAMDAPARPGFGPAQ